MSAAAVDLTHLARYTGGDVALNAEILRLFDSQASELVVRCSPSSMPATRSRGRKSPHTLKGAARGIGAFGLGDAAAAAEPIDPLSDSMTAAAALQALQSNTSAVQYFIKAYLGA